MKKRSPKRLESHLPPSVVKKLKVDFEGVELSVFATGVDVKEIARQLTLIESTEYHKIHPDDYIMEDSDVSRAERGSWCRHNNRLMY
jgi:hypothetical protein